MILVTVGMHTQPFDRLVQAADQMSALTRERVLIQRGCSRYLPLRCQHFGFVNEARIQEWLSAARLVVAHAGAGTILRVLQAHKPLVLAPRLRRFSEHFDDHQLELAEALTKQGRAVVVTDLSAETLWKAIVLVPQLAKVSPPTTKLQEMLQSWLEQQSTQLSRRQERIA